MAGRPGSVRAGALIACGLSLAALMSGSALAQAQNPGAAARPPTAQELDRTPPANQSQSPQVSVNSRGIGAGPCPDAIANSPLTAPLTSVNFAGPAGAALPPEIAALLAGVGAGLDGSARPLAEICRLRDAASAALTGARYVAAVQVPEQTLADGVLNLTVVTAQITELRVRGNPGRSQVRLEELLGRLKELNPLNEQDAERILLLASDIPGTSVTLELRPSASGKPGEVIGEIVIDRRGGSLILNVQNYGSEQIGRWSGVVRGEMYGLTGLADRTFLSVFATTEFKELVVLQGGHDFGIGNNGLRIGANVTYAWTKPTLPDANLGLDLQSRSILASITASYPLVRTSSQNLRATGGFDMVEQRTRAVGQLINLDKIRTVYARLDGDAQPRRLTILAPAWRIGGFIEARKGLGILGATRTGQVSGTAIPTRFEGNAQAFIARAGFNGEARLRFGPSSPYAATVSADIRGQWTNDPLMAFDEFAVGNLTLGRGYDPGATAGDRVIGGAFEFRLGKPVPITRNDWALEAVAFYDRIHIENLDTNNFESNRNLASVGGGVRATWGSRFRLDVMYAKPLDKALAIDTVKPPGRVLISFTVRALPWR